ncbi:hypothetical protein StoSoilB22_34110 [Arthrobacter sp. StoSoilB22]|nr:hypothetical protein StoSoilB22_34110 [Arthrobacter sp. StoSoilB22]
MIGILQSPSKINDAIPPTQAVAHVLQNKGVGTHPERVVHHDEALLEVEHEATVHDGSFQGRAWHALHGFHL